MYESARRVSTKVTTSRYHGSMARKQLDQKLVTEFAEYRAVKAAKNHIDQVDVKVNPGYMGKLLAPLVKKLDCRTPRGF